MDLWTIQLAQWRKAKAAGIELIDITHKSGLRIFAPEPDWLYAYKRGELSIDRYSALYLDKIARCCVNTPECLAMFTGKENLAIACYCPSNTFCHRRLFTPVLKMWLERQGVMVNYKGEFK